jgi:replicative DNA helicase
MSEPITDLEAESAVISACLADPKSVSAALTVCAPEDFYDLSTRSIFAVMAELDGLGWDVTQVAREIRRQSGDAAARQAMRLMVDLGGAPFTGRVLEHSRAIYEAAQNRKMVLVLRSALVSAEQRRVGEARELLLELDKLERSDTQILSLQQMALGAYQKAKEPRARHTLTWGNYQLDDMTGGIRPAHTGVIGAGTSQGKSSKVIHIAKCNISRGARVLVVSNEDDEQVYGNRFVASYSGTSAKNIRDHCIADEDHSAITEAINGMSNAPMFMHVQDMPWERVALKIDQTVLREQIDLVFLDYIQECWCETRYNSRQLELQAVARRFRGIMRRRKRAGIICSQLTGYEPGKPPSKEMARECKDITNGAEQILLLYTSSEGERMGNLDKSKEGETGIVKLNWNSVTASYEKAERIDEAMAWADERYDGFSATCADIDGAIAGF